MSGIYLHIPFCRSKCSYCDFYSVANKTRIPDFVNSLLLEIENRKSILSSQTVNTIYFGGGTPSILSLKQIEQILTHLYSNFKISASPEISFEANPDNLSEEYLTGINNLGINRLSVGIQSLDDNILKFLRRNHSSQTAIKSIELASKAGFKNISVDLIYGIPSLDEDTWRSTLQNALKMPVQHLSAYHLGVEKNTLLYKQYQNNIFNLVDEDSSFKQYSDLIEISDSMGFPQYEISNFAKPGMKSKHNSAYWQHKDYLGLGPSAHSFYNNKIRAFNTSNIAEYIEKSQQNQSFTTQETLDNKDLHNEVIMLSLRTTQGLDLERFRNRFGENAYKELADKLNPTSNNLFKISEKFLYLTNEGMFISDCLIGKLFL